MDSSRAMNRWLLLLVGSARLSAPDPKAVVSTTQAEVMPSRAVHRSSSSCLTDDESCAMIRSLPLAVLTRARGGVSRLAARVDCTGSIVIDGRYPVTIYATGLFPVAPMWNQR